MMRRGAMLLGVFVCLALLPAAADAAQDDYPPPWPASDVTFTVPFSQGSETDMLFSPIKEAFAAKTGKNMTARYVSGRAGADAWARIIDDAPDGSVLTAVLLPDAYLRTLQPDSGVRLRSMGICAIIAYMPSVLWTDTPGAFGSLGDVTDTAAAMNGNFLVAGSGSYSASQLAARALDRETGVRTFYVPYTGTVTAARAVLNQQASVFWGFSVRVRVPGFEGAAFRPLAVASPNRLPALAETPTFTELGLAITEGVYIAIAVPADTPAITREEISEYFSALAKDPAYRAKATALGFAPVDIGMDAVPAFLAELKDAAAAKARDFSLSEQ
ncbi:MAG: hypothetical protein LIP28_10370 [Deltaproteobacteria bacterium]|nr:hypothetical protein [Deltaproteobacteria bacterium]